MNASYVLFFLGIMSTFASIAILATSRPLRGGVITTGTVTDNQRESSTIQVRGTRRRMTTYAPVVQYTDQAGVTHHVTPSISGGKAPEIGSTRQVSYLPSNPDRARLLANSTTWVPIVLFLVVGLGMLIAALTMR